MPSKEIAISVGLDKITRVFLGRRAPGSVGHTQAFQQTFFSIERRRVLVPLVNQHKAILLEKMPSLNLRQVVDSIDIIFRQRLNKYIDNKTIKWFDKNTIVCDKLNTLESMLAQLRREVRQLAIINANKENRSSSDLNEDISTSLVLGGIDPRFEKQGGDVRRTDLERGILITGGSPSKAKAVGNTRLTNVSKENGTGFQAGHVFGPGVRNILSITGTEEKPNPIMELFSPDIQSKFIRFREIAVKIDAKMVIRTNLLSKAGKREGTISILIAEATSANRISGNLLDTKAIKPFKKLLSSERKLLEIEYEKIVGTYHDSPTIVEQYRVLIEELFLTGKVKSKRKVKRYKHSTTIKLKIPVYGPRLRTLPIQKRVKPKGNTQNLNELIVFLNAKLTDKIRQNMGKGRSRLKLNWRTGDFGRSAKIKQFLPSRDKNTIVAKVKYWGYPRYHRFEKGGDLYKKLRDPAGIFGRSIRQLLQEEKIATLKRVKVILNG